MMCGWAVDRMGGGRVKSHKFFLINVFGIFCTACNWSSSPSPPSSPPSLRALCALFVPFVPSVLLVPRERSLVLTNTVVQWRASMTWGHDDDDNMRIWGRRYEDLMVMVWRYDHVMMKSGLNQYRGRPPPSLTFVSLPNFARLYRWWWSASPVFVFVSIFASPEVWWSHNQLGNMQWERCIGDGYRYLGKMPTIGNFIAIIVKHRAC